MLCSVFRTFCRRGWSGQLTTQDLTVVFLGQSVARIHGLYKTPDAFAQYRQQQQQQQRQQRVGHSVLLIKGYHKPSIDKCPRLRLGQLSTLGLDIEPIWKQPCDNLFIVQSNLPIRQRINYFICHNSLLECAQSNWWMTDRLLRCLYSALAPAATTNKRRPSLPMTYGNSKLSYGQ